MRTHAVSVEVGAPPREVWRTLSDLRQYPRWNRTITRAAGDLTPGAELTLWLDLGTESRSFEPAVVEVQPGHLLVLEKVLLRPAVLRAMHSFRLTPLAMERTRLTQEWHLSGLLAPVVWPRFRAGLPAFARMSEDLAREVERRGAHA